MTLRLGSDGVVRGRLVTEGEASGSRVGTTLAGRSGRVVSGFAGMEGRGGELPRRLLPAILFAVGGYPSGVYWVPASAVWGCESGVRA